MNKQEEIREGIKELVLEIGKQGYAKTGKRASLNGLYVRSSWECNYALYLNFLIANPQGNSNDVIEWKYEPDTFEFKKIKKGTRFYTPDFKVTFRDARIEYHEVKGYMDAKSKTRLKRFAKYYPQFKLALIQGDFFKALKKQGMDRLIANWE